MIGLRSRKNRKTDTATQQLVWQACSVLLSYPDAAVLGQLDVVDGVAAGLPDKFREPLQRSVSWLREQGAEPATRNYVATFDMKRRHTLYLTYFTAGDTRRRGTAMLEFADTYRFCGVEPPTDELPDHLPLVLEFAATVDADRGLGLLISHRAALGLIHASLEKVKSGYADVMAAVVATLPPPSDDEITGVRDLARNGPPAENVGLEPFPLPMPTRRTP